MRKRKRPDWQVKVFRFAIKPIGEIPQEIFSTAKRMQIGWNKLVDLREDIRKRIADFIIANPNLEETELSKAKKEMWASFDKEAKQILNAEEFNFNWESKQEIIDRFNKSISLKQHPKKQYKLMNFSLLRIFGEGGREIDKLFKKDVSAISIRPVKEEMYNGYTAWHQRMKGSKGYFEVNKDIRLNFSFSLSMYIPRDGFLKRANIIARKNSLGWRWWLVLTCEYPPTIIQNVLPDKICGLDLGWRRFEEYIRIGMLVDQEGNTRELKLPLGYTNNTIRKTLSKFPVNERKPLSTWADLEEFNQKIGLEVEALKTKIKNEVVMDLLPEEIKSSITHITMMRQNGLKRLLFEMEQAGVNGKNQKVVDALRDWVKLNTILEQKLQRGRDRLLRNREIQYRALSKELSNSYSCIAWESDLDLKTMAEDKDQLKISINPALKNSMYYRHTVSLYTFRSYLKDASNKSGASLSLTKAKNTTIKCCICNGDIINDGKLIQACTNGHKLDQDINAAVNLLKKVAPNFDTSKISKYLK